MKKIIFFLFLTFFGASLVFSQGTDLITIDGKQFKRNGADFYPFILSYVVDIFQDGNNYIMTPTKSYNANNNPGTTYECNDQATCNQQISDDFYYIRNVLKFNTIRIFGTIHPIYDERDFVLKCWVTDATGWNWAAPLDVNPQLNNPGFTVLLQFYAKLIELAYINDLKIIFYAGEFPRNSFEEDLWNELIKYLAITVAASPYSDAVMAYDIGNEPCFNDYAFTMSKYVACQLINRYYTTCKDNDPDRLVTLGSCGYADVFSFDPAIIKLDFWSIHDYPGWNNYLGEDRRTQLIQDRMRTRVYNNFYWAMENCPIPWIIGEVGYTTNSNDQTFNPPPDWYLENLDGTLTEMANYADKTLEAGCNCGAGGYSVWTYQDFHWFPPTPQWIELKEYAQNYYGILFRDIAPSPQAEKPVTQEYKDFADNLFCDGITPVACPVDRYPTFNPAKLYYNPYLIPTTNKAVTGTVTDQDGQPIKDAVIAGHIFLGYDSQNKIKTDYYHTFSDDNGFFSYLPYNFQPFGNNIPNAGKVGNLEVTAAGAEKLKWAAQWFAWQCLNSCGTLPPTPTNTNDPPVYLNISLSREKYYYDNFIHDIVVSTDRNFKGYNTLSMQNISVLPGVNADFTARNEILVHTEFTASANSEVHIYTSEVFPDCDDYFNHTWQQREPFASLNSGNAIADKSIELSFKKRNTKLTIMPNPNRGEFTISTQNKEEIISYIEIFNTVGKKVSDEIINSSEGTVNLSFLPKGIYILKAFGIKQTFFQKLIIH